MDAVATPELRSKALFLCDQYIKNPGAGTSLLVLRPPWFHRGHGSQYGLGHEGVAGEQAVGGPPPAGGAFDRLSGRSSREMSNIP